MIKLVPLKIFELLCIIKANARNESSKNQKLRPCQRLLVFCRILFAAQEKNCWWSMMISSSAFQCGINCITNTLLIPSKVSSDGIYNQLNHLECGLNVWITFAFHIHSNRLDLSFSFVRWHWFRFFYQRWMDKIYDSCVFIRQHLCKEAKEFRA